MAGVWERVYAIGVLEEVSHQGVPAEVKSAESD